MTARKEIMEANVKNTFKSSSNDPVWNVNRIEGKKQVNVAKLIKEMCARLIQYQVGDHNDAFFISLYVW